MSITVSIDGADALRRMGVASALLSQPHPLLDAIGAIIEAHTALRYEQRTDGAGRPWAQLAPGTLKSYKYKYKQGTPGHLLERSGLMRDSLSRNTTSAYTEVGFSEPYALYHVTGTKKMPRRDPLLAAISGNTGTLAAADEAAIIDVVNKMLGGAL